MIRRFIEWRRSRMLARAAETANMVVDQWRWCARNCLPPYLESALAKLAQPTPIITHCPNCGIQHVDRGEWATKSHKTHLCECCGHLWRPHDYPTVGVEEI